MKHKQSHKRDISCFTFTLATIKTMQEAMKLFEQSLWRADQRSSMVVFAEETMKHVKDKLEAMSQSVGVIYFTTFDYNERIVIMGAIQLYTITLISFPPNPKHERELKNCQQIAAYFALDSSK